jgi:hypothetical protein
MQTAKTTSRTAQQSLFIIGSLKLGNSAHQPFVN